MNASNQPPLNSPADDKDLVEQANPGHGIPSQDPEAAAQTALTPAETDREEKSVLVGGGVAAGAMTGALVGATVAGPAGSLAGATVGAVAGILGGAAAGATVAPEGDDDTLPPQAPRRAAPTDPR